MNGIYNVEREGDGWPKLSMPRKAPPTARQMFTRRCYLNAVTDPAEVHRLWAEESTRRKAAKGESKKKGKVRR